MANLRPHRQNGVLKSIYIRVSNGRGKKPFEEVFHVPPGISEEEAYRKALEAAGRFEEKCRSHKVPAEKKLLFRDYALRVLDERLAKGNIKQRTYDTYVDYVSRLDIIWPGKKLAQISVKDMNQLPMILPGATIVTAIPTQLCQDILAGVAPLGETAAPLKVKRGGRGVTNDTLAAACTASSSVISKVRRGLRIQGQFVASISEALGYPPEALFEIDEKTNSLAKKTAKNYFEMISGILSRAVDDGYLAENVAKRAETVKVKKTEADYYQPHVVRKVLELIANEAIYWRTILYVIIFTGMRRGEAMGIRYSDVDFIGKTIYVHQQLQYSSKRGVYVETPKGYKPRRIPVPDTLLSALMLFQSWSIDERMRLDDEREKQKDKGGKQDKKNNSEWADEDLIFINPETGCPYNPDSFTDWFGDLNHKFADENLPHLKAHAFRHTYASVLINMDANLKEVQTLLGHSTAQVTSEIYCHIFDQTMRISVAQILSSYGEIGS